MVATMKRRLPKLAPWLASIYLIWSLFVYFGRLGRSGHEWWPLLLYFVIWPLSALYEFVNSRCLDLLFPDRSLATDRFYMMNDYIGGAFYIVIGTIWIWFLGWAISTLLTRLFPVKKHETAA